MNDDIIYDNVFGNIEKVGLKKLDIYRQWTIKFVTLFYRTCYKKYDCVV